MTTLLGLTFGWRGLATRERLISRGFSSSSSALRFFVAVVALDLVEAFDLVEVTLVEAGLVDLVELDLTEEAIFRGFAASLVGFATSLVAFSFLVGFSFTAFSFFSTGFASATLELARTRVGLSLVADDLGVFFLGGILQIPI
jgi:hypothetical protein